MSTSPCVVLYGNSMFLAGIRADLQGQTELELITVEPSYPDVARLIGGHRPGAVIFDLAAAQPDFAVALLREQPDLLLIGLDASSDELLVLSSRAEQALSLTDLIKVIHQKQSK